MAAVPIADMPTSTTRRGPKRSNTFPMNAIIAAPKR